MVCNIETWARIVGKRGPWADGGFGSLFKAISCLTNEQKAVKHLHMMLA